MKHGIDKFLWKMCNRVSQLVSFKTGLKVMKHFSCSNHLSTKIFLLINVKIPTIFGILIFMSG